jgi:dATP pyrophosphohydrolase
MEVLVLRRAAGGRNAGSWECVHGAIEDGEHPVAAARREAAEEAGVGRGAWYNLSRVEAFYRHDRDEVALIPGFVVFIAADIDAVLSAEHDAFAWLSPAAAQQRVAWPRVRRAIADLVELLGGEHPPRVADVLRID